MSRFSDLVEALAAFGAHDLGEGVSTSDVARCEGELRVPIRGEFREFLLRFGAGGVGSFEVFGLGGDPVLDLVRETKSARGQDFCSFPNYLLPVSNDGSGGLYCLDTRISPEPTVVYWDHEDPDELDLDVEAGSFCNWFIEAIEEEREG